MKRHTLCLSLLIALNFLTLRAADTPQPLRVTVLPEPICRLRVPLTLGFQLGIPARDDSAFYAECFSTDVLEREIAQLNERIEIGLLVSHTVDENTGEITVRLVNESEELRGITLRTGHLLRERSYSVRVRGGKERGDRGVTLRVTHMHAEEVLSEEEQRISRWRKESELEWSVTPRINGFHRCAFLLQPGSAVTLRGFSMLPEGSPSIWRRESIDVLRSTGAGVLRWPVVDGMDFYNFYDGIGARALRLPVQPGKTGLRQHDFGTAEYVDLCRVVGVEPLICVPLFTPACGDPRIGNLGRAAQLAADWVAYCNAGGSHPLAVLRKKNGIGKALRVGDWELTAPAAGPLLPAEMIAEACAQTISAMKQEDPSIRVGVALADENPQTLAVLLRTTGSRMDFISCNAPGAHAIVSEFNRTQGTAVMLAGTMLRPEPGAYALQLLESFAGVPGGDGCVNWYNSLGLAHAAVQRLDRGQDGPVALPYYAEQVLGLDYGTTRLSTDIALLSAMIGRFPAVEPLKLQATGGADDGAPKIYAAWTEGAAVLVIFAYNPAAVEQTLTLDLSQLGKSFHFWIMDQLSGDMRSDWQGESSPVLRRQRAGAVSEERVLTCPLGPASFARILVKE